jgi:hypothetical protein
LSTFTSGYLREYQNAISIYNDLKTRFYTQKTVKMRYDYVMTQRFVYLFKRVLNIPRVSTCDISILFLSKDIFVFPVYALFYIPRMSNAISAYYYLRIPLSTPKTFSLYIQFLKDLFVFSRLFQ